MTSLDNCFGFTTISYEESLCSEVHFVVLSYHRSASCHRIHCLMMRISLSFNFYRPSRRDSGSGNSWRNCNFDSDFMVLKVFRTLFPFLSKAPLLHVFYSILNWCGTLSAFVSPFVVSFSKSVGPSGNRPFGIRMDAKKSLGASLALSAPLAENSKSHLKSKLSSFRISIYGAPSKIGPISRR